MVNLAFLDFLKVHFRLVRLRLLLILFPSEPRFFKWISACATAQL